MPLDNGTKAAGYPVWFSPWPCDQAGMHIITGKTEVLCLSTNPSQFALQVSGSTLEEVGEFNGVHDDEVVVTECGTRRFGKINALLR